MNADDAPTTDQGWALVDFMARIIAREWLTVHDRAVKAKVLREAVADVRASDWWADGSDNYASKVRGWLIERADKIEKGSDR